MKIENLMKIANWKLKIDRRRLRKVAAGFLAVALVGIIVARLLAPTASAAWWDESWQYRKAIAIPSHTTAENNVYVTVPAFDATDTTKFQADCGDLRFTKQNGELLPYYVVDCDSTANIHVQFDTLPVGASTYYMYYGNPSAPNGTETADFTTPASGLGTQTAGSEEKSAGPVAYWKFDDASGTSAQDATVNNNDGTITGATWQTEDQCISGKCLYFDNSTSQVAVADPSSGSLDPTSALSLEAWIRPIDAGQNGFGRVFARVSNVDVFLQNLSNNKLDLCAQTNGTTDTCPSAVVNANQWNHVAIVYTSGNQRNFYVNGKLVASNSSTNSLSDGASKGIGYTPAAARVFHGFIDDVKIYSYARTAAQVKADYAARGTSKGSAATLSSSKGQGDFLSNGLVGYWKTDEASWNGTAGEVIDSSGNGNNGQSNPTGPWTGPTTASGKFGNGGSFDGSDDYVSLATSTSLNITSNITMSVWVKTSSTTGSVIIGGYNAGADNTGYGLGFGQTVAGKISYWSQTYGSWVTANSLINDGLWHHIAVSVSGTTATFYKDGQIDGTVTTNVPSSYSGTRAIGARKDGLSPFTGSIDDVRVYNRALTPSEVSQLYAWAPGPVGYWNFDEKTGTTVNDKSGNGKNGSFSGSPTWTPGKYGGGLSVTPSDNATITDDALHQMLNKSWTVSSWVKTTSNTAYILRKLSGQEWYYQYVNPSGYHQCGTKDGTTEAYLNSTGTTINNGSWHYISCVWDRDANLLRNYVDGVQITTTSISSLGSVDNAATFSLGVNTSGITGTIDDVRVYNYARTAKQIVEDMNAGHPAPGSPVGSAIGYWKFNEGYGGTANNSGNGGSTLNGTISGALWSNSGKFGKALVFDGNDDYVTKSDNYTLDIGTGSYTASLWYKGSTTASSDSLINKGATASTTKGFWWQFSASGIMRLLISDGSSFIVDTSGTTNIADNIWHYLSFTWDPVVGAKMYIDGRLEKSASVTSVADINATLALNIGGYTSTSYTVNGTIDEVKIYNSALTAEEIKLDMNRGSAQVLGALGDNSSYASGASNQQYCVPGDSTSCSAPVGEWNFEEKSGTSANDVSGNGNGLTWTNTNWGTNCKFGGCAGFTNTGVQQKLSVADPVSGILDFTNSQDFTTEIWVRYTNNDSPNAARFLTKGLGNPGFAGYSIYVDSSNNNPVCAYSDGDGSGSEAGTTTTNIKDGKWHYLACVMDRSGTATGTAGYHIFIDGKLSGSDTTLTEGSSVNSSALDIGEYTNASEYDGALDNTRIYNYARTPAQIAWDYNRGGPVGHWKFDECQGTTANDSSGNRNSGTITIGASGEDTVGTCSTASTAWGSGATGKFNSSLNFDGVDDFISVTNNSGLQPTTAVTVSAWVKMGAFFDSWIISNQTAVYDANFGYELREDDPTNTFYFRVGNGSTNAVAVSASGLSTGTWYHVVGVYDGSTTYVYLNGKRTTGGSLTAPINYTGVASSMYIGQRSSNNFRVNGQIDDVRIFNYALTATQIKQLFNGGAAIKFGPSTGTP